MLLERDIPVSEGWDVIVVGGGPAGCAAAAAASRQGAKTLLLEATGCLGGMGTNGLVTTWAPFGDYAGHCIYGGLAERLLVESRSGMPHIDQKRLNWVPFRAEHLKRLYDSMVLDSGAHILFGQQLCGVEAGSGSVTALIVAAKSGLTAFRARVFVDATGDGDLAAFAGASFEKGDPSGALQSATLCFLMAGVDDRAYAKTSLHPKDPASPIYDVVKSGDYPHIRDPHCCNDLSGPGVVSFNAGHVYNVDGTDPASVSAGLVEGRRVAADYERALRQCSPEAFGRAFLVQTAPSLGIRETRRILGDYYLTTDDYLARKHFPDEIGVNNYWIDIHSASDEHAPRFERYRPGETHGIPYRCLTPKGLANLLVSGRCISTDRAVNGAVRVMPASLVTGEAAGVAAAMALQSGNVHSVDTDSLRQTLRAHGAYLP